MVTTARTLGFVDDISTWSLVLTNGFAIGFAVWFDLLLVDLILVYWVQSVVIGVTSTIRIATLKSYSTDDFEMDSQGSVVRSFIFNYTWMHAVILLFILIGIFGEYRLGWELVICSLAFAVNHTFSYRYHRELDKTNVPNIGTLFLAPFLRVIPLFLIIVIPLWLGGEGFNSFYLTSAGILLFGIVRMCMDVCSHYAEHRMLGHYAKQ